MKTILLFLVICSSLLAYDYDLAICAIFQDEAKYLPEWIEFHEKMGVEHFYLYNNNSQDDYKEALSPYIQEGKVDLFEWCFEYDSEIEWTRIQTNAYLDCAKRIKRHVKWCAFIDTDEFLFCPLFVDLKTILKGYNDYPAVVAHWVMYGNSNIEKVPKDENMLDFLTWRADFGNSHFKTIAKPKEIFDCSNPHFFYYYNGKAAVNEKKEPIENDKQFSSTFTAKIFRINHYWSRDMDFFFNVKIPRRLKWGNDLDFLFKLEKGMHSEYDPILKGI